MITPAGLEDHLLENEGKRDKKRRGGAHSVNSDSYSAISAFSGQSKSLELHDYARGSRKPVA